MRSSFLLSVLVFFLIVVTPIAYKGSRAFCAQDNKQELLQSGFENLRKGYLDVARDYFNKAILLDKKNYDAYVGLGTVYLRKGDPDNAIAYLNKAISLDKKDSRVYLGLGNAYARRGDIEKAIAYLNKAISLDKKDSRAYVGLGMVYLRKGDPDNAIAYLNKAISLDGEYSRAYYLLGMAYVFINKKESALEKHKILENLDKDLADRLYRQIQLRFATNKLTRGIWPMRLTDNLYFPVSGKRNIILYTHKDLSKYDGAHP